MKGRYNIRIRNSICEFNLCIERNITVIRGDSGTGKTVFADIVQDYNEYGESSGISIETSSDIDIVRLTSIDNINNYRKGSTIFVVDEFDKLLRNEDLFVKDTSELDCYFILITRKKLSSLPYSINSLYRFVVDGSMISLEKPYHVNTLQRIYHDNFEFMTPDVVYTEDKGSGNQFFKMVLSCDCVSSGGKGNVYKKLKSCNMYKKNAVAIVDGAAFGSDVEDVVQLSRHSSYVYLIAPESFEYSILCAVYGVNDDKLVSHYMSMHGL